jgi:hypothetical protein
VDIFKAAARLRRAEPVYPHKQTLQEIAGEAFRLLIEHPNAETHFEKRPSTLPRRVSLSGNSGKVPSKRASRGVETTSELEARSKAPSRTLRMRHSSWSWPTPPFSISHKGQPAHPTSIRCRKTVVPEGELKKAPRGFCSELKPGSHSL